MNPLLKRSDRNIISNIYFDLNHAEQHFCESELNICLVRVSFRKVFFDCLHGLTFCGQIAYDTPWSTVTRPAVFAVVDKFAGSLRAYGHRGLGPRRYRSPAFDDRADLALVALVRRCNRLTRLVVRDRVSTATLIVLAAEGLTLFLSRPILKLGILHNSIQLHVQRVTLSSSNKWRRQARAKGD